MFELKSLPRHLAALPSFHQGLFYVQDPGTLLAVRELAPQPGETVLDLCAAPGGKLTYAAQLMADQGRLVAYDINPGRLKLIEENCARLGVKCVQILSAVPSGSESAPHRNLNLSLNPDLPLPDPQYKRLGLREAGFDRILIDAPCSNTGVLRRRVELRWRIRPQEIKRLRNVQLGLLAQAAALLKPAGTLVYSTCSMEPEENAHMVNEFLASHPSFKCETERELLPFRDSVDGAYVARIRRLE
jgi:16S rRNA (cytosine967-C5)-methyltransferase